MISLKLTAISQFSYSSSDGGNGFYTVRAVGMSDETIYSVSGERLAEIYSFELLLRCPEFSGGTLKQHARCHTPARINAIARDDESTEYSATLFVTVGRKFLDMLAGGHVIGVPTLLIWIAAVDMSSDRKDNKRTWNTAETGESTITGLTAYFDTEALIDEELEKSRIDPVPELIATTNKKLDQMRSLMTCVLIALALVVVGVWKLQR